MKGRLIAFEGVDGSGKSTVIRRVAQALGSQGHTVFMPRSGKEHDSRPTRMIRRLARDRRNLDLSALSELLLYCAREAQVLHELVRPALARGETVLVDRSLLTPVVLGTARGLSLEKCEAAASLAADGTEPDLTLIFDVHPRTSRLRKRIEKIRDHALGSGGRKGLGGTGLKSRVREGYQRVALAQGHPLFHVERADPDTMTERVMDVITRGAGPVQEQASDAMPSWQVAGSLDLEAALQAIPTAAALFLSKGLVAGRAIRLAAFEAEPALAAWAMDAADPLRERAAQVEPDYALRAWARRPLDGAQDLRLRLLGSAPDAALSALRHVDAELAEQARQEYGPTAPNGLLRSLGGRSDAAALKMRAQAWSEAEEDARASCLVGCDDEDAWRRREKLLDKNPVSALASLRSVCGPRADELLDHYALLAPKTVLGALGGRDDALAYELRERLWDTGREVIDSVRGLDDEGAWAMRERALEEHPSTVIHSLTAVPDGPRRDQVRERAEVVGQGDVHCLRRSRGLDEYDEAPEWVRLGPRGGEWTE